MFKRIINRIKIKLVSWLYNRLQEHESRFKKAVTEEMEYKKHATIGLGVNFSDRARIYNNLKDSSKIIIGNNCLIYGDLLTFTHGGNITLGSSVFVGENSRIWSSTSIKIGNNVLISHNVNIHDNNSHPIDLNERNRQMEFILIKGFLPANEFGVKEAPIVIGDNVWVGFNAAIFKGVTIGEGSIIGAGTYVFHDVPPFSIVVGNPAKIIGKTN